MLLMLCRSRRALATPGRGLGVAVRAQPPEVLEAVVEPVTVDVVDHEGQRGAAPLRLTAAVCADLRYPEVLQCSTQMSCLRSIRSGRQNDQHVCWIPSTRGSLPPVVRPTGEVGGVD